MKTQKLKVTLNEIKRMKELAGINSLNESRGEDFFKGTKQEYNLENKTDKNILKKRLNETFLMRISDIDDIYPRKVADTDDKLLQRYEMELELYNLLTSFWDKYNIPRRLKEPEKPKMKGYTSADVAKKDERQREKIRKKELKRKQRLGKNYTPPTWLASLK